MRSDQIPFARLELSRADIYLMMGSGAYDPDPQMQQLIEQTITHVSGWCQPQFSYRLFEISERSANALVVDGCRLTTGPIITHYMRDADYLAVFIATAGAQYQQWFEQEAHSGDILREFVAHNIGSEIAEAAGRYMGQTLAAECAAKGLVTGNPYSPGYCGWDITDQRILFALMRTATCGVTLSDSCLMNPIKSVSGIIPVGRAVKKEAYGCEICNKKSCYKNNLKNKTADEHPTMD